MKRSTARFLTTHVGSLARPPGLLELMFARERGQDYDPDAFKSSVRNAVDELQFRWTSSLPMHDAGSSRVLV